MSDVAIERIRCCTETKPKTSNAAVNAAVKENPENLPRVQVGTWLGTPRDQWRDSLALLTGKKWAPGRTITVWFGQAGRGVVDRVVPYFIEWMRYANIRFERTDDRNRADVRVGFVEGEGSWSYLGPDHLTIPKDEFTMNFGWLTPDESEEEYRRVVLHEVGHLLGCVHEHQSPSGGFEWDKPVVNAYYSGPPNQWSQADIDHNIYRRYSETNTNFTNFDRESIMAYPIPNEFTIGDFWVPFNSQLSAQDKAFIAAMYPHSTGPTEPTEPTGPEEERVRVFLSQMVNRPDRYYGRKLLIYDRRGGRNQDRWKADPVG